MEQVLNKIKKNFFISFEGPEASGKSSQIKLLAIFLKKNKIPFLITREPGGTIISEKLRKIILDKNEIISPTEELLLLMASRLNHINKVIKPALEEGKLVISDRFVDSTFVYQGIIGKYGLEKTKILHKNILNNFLPKKTFLFLLKSENIIQRLKKRKFFNKYDKLDINFHNRILNGYKRISKKNNRFHIVNASQSKNLIHSEIISVLNKIK